MKYESLLPCLFKHLTGFDCPGCGFQRSILALIQGEYIKSFQLYPAAIFILIFLLISLVGAFSSSKNLYRLRTSFLWLSATIVLVSYIIKIID